MIESINPVALVLLVAGGLLLLSLWASKLGGRLGLPSLLLFLVIGMLAGSDGPGGIAFEDYALTQLVGTIALSFILFGGGLETRWSSTRPVLWAGLSLASLGVLVTAGVVGLTAHLLLGLPWITALLLGAIVAPTDASAVFSVLRERGLGLKGQIKPLLEFESGINDPTAVVLVVGLTHLAAHPDASAFTLLSSFVQELMIGGVVGYAFGRILPALLNRVGLPLEGLYPVLTVALVSLMYGFTTALHGSGFLAVYIAAVMLGNAEFVHKRSLRQFHDGLSYLLEVAMFLILGLLVFPSQLPAIALPALLLALILVFVARPVSVFLGLSFSKMPLTHKAMVAWVGLRGAVPIILATFPLLAGIEGAQTLFNVAFFLVLVSILLQGTSLPYVAWRLKVDAPPDLHQNMPLEYTVSGTDATQTDMLEVEVHPHSSVVGRRIVELGLTQSALIVLLRRGDEYIIPRGSTALEAGDVVQILGQQSALEEAKKRLGQPSVWASGR